MIRLRQSLDAGLRHPLLGPLLLLGLALILAFVALHAVEHGAGGMLFSCALLAAATIKLVLAAGPAGTRAREARTIGPRGAARPAVRLALPPPAAAHSLPLRR